MIAFVLGALLGALLLYAFYWRATAEVVELAEERNALLEERQVILQFMREMVAAVEERVPRDELFQRIVHSSILSTGALSACIFERGDDDLLRGVAMEGLFPPHRPIPDTAGMGMSSRSKFIEQILRSEVFPVGEGIVGRVAATGQGELIPDAPLDDRIVHHDDPALQVRSVIASPILVGKKVIGVLCVCNASDGRPFNAADYALVGVLAEQAGLAMHNADYLSLQIAKQKLELELVVASNVQQMLLPHTMPVCPGLEIDARYLAAQKVTGDLYDVFSLGDQRLAVAVADVSGKGVPASLLMATARALLRQIAPRGDSPAGVLSEINRALAGDVLKGMYITMTYAVVDLTGSRITWARAGHELPLFWHAVDGRPNPEFPGSEGMPIGMVEPALFDEVIQNRTVPFAPGDILLLYTDGLTEAPNLEDKEFGGARLADALRGTHERTAADINAYILQVVQHFTGGAGLRDDFTLVTIKSTGGD